jgi:hypothetical protein
MAKAVAICPLGYQAYQKDIPCIQKSRKNNYVDDH